TAAQRAAWQGVFSQPIPGGPTTRGFDTYFGTDVPNWPPYCFIEDNRTLGIPSEFLPVRLLGNNQASLAGPALPKWTLEPILPALRDRAVRFITEAAQRPEPFLLYLPLTTPHTPLAVNAEWRGRSGLNAFADLVMETDAAVGRVLAALEQSGAAQNTLVLFTADNGCAPYIGVPELEKQGHFPSGPLRGYKTSVYEGGHRVPFIVRWPGVVPPGTQCDQLVHQADLLATLADVLGTKLPANAGEDSFSMLPLLRGGAAPVRENAVSCASAGTPGFRLGSWKLVLAADPKAGTEVELYDLATDLGETKNLAAENPARVAELKSRFEHLISRGRSTPGAPQPNDVEVRRYPQKPAPTKNARKTAK
ncbi:MAG: arylsulfatase, partial [Verrucomicrobia bacterium]|nr:arylsulfatase [Verrucomicrobiota bacterium]